MLFRFPKSFAAAVLLVALWGLSRIRSSGEDAWVRVPGSIPGRVRILLFQASVGSLTEGEKAQLCYGVANAKTVKLEPQDNPVWPSYNRCVEVAPKKDTTYTLTIQDAAGHTQTQTLDIKVK